MLACVLVGSGGLLALGARQNHARANLSWRRLMLSAFVLWGIPTVYFLTHAIRVGYYAIPATFATVTLLALGALTIQAGGSAGGWGTGCAGYRGRRWILLALAIVPGIVALESAWTFYTRMPDRPLGVARGLTLPAELAVERAWVWADLLTGTLW